MTMLTRIIKWFAIIFIIIDIVFTFLVFLSAQKAIERYNTREMLHNNLTQTKVLYENKANTIYKELEGDNITQNEMYHYLSKYQIKYFEPKIKICYDGRGITSISEQSEYDTACSDKKIDAENVRPDFEKQFQSLSDIGKEFSKVSNIESYNDEILKTYTASAGENFLVEKLESYLEINPIYYGDSGTLLKQYSEGIWYIISLNMYFVLCIMLIVIFGKLSKKYGVTKVKLVLFYSILSIVISVIGMYAINTIISLYLNRNVCPSGWYHIVPKQGRHEAELFHVKREEPKDYFIINGAKVDSSNRDIEWIKKNCPIHQPTYIDE